MVTLVRIPMCVPMSGENVRAPQLSHDIRTLNSESQPVYFMHEFVCQPYPSGPWFLILTLSLLFLDSRLDANV
jgi:hypothetical protein